MKMKLHSLQKENHKHSSSHSLKFVPLFV